LLWGVVSTSGAAGQAQPNAPPPAPWGEIRIGYVELENDRRYDEERAYARIQLRPLDRPFAAAELALAEAESIGRVIRVRFALARASAASAEALAEQVRRWASDENIHFVVADLPGEALAELARRTRALPVVILNATAPDDRLRGEDCQPHLAHTGPSLLMQADALMQYLVFRKWTSLLVLQGPLPEDAQWVAAVQRAARKFGAKVVEVRPFQLTNDPRQREQTNVALLTGGVEHDVVLVADSDGEFGRYVPYQTQRPRPVVGTVGLVPEAWHWSWERNGGPQLNSRFEKKTGRRLTGQDWAVWVAVKAIVQAALRTRSVEFEATRRYLLGEQMNLDGFKGNPLSFRAWDRQLRQPLLLSTANAVIQRAPLRGFLHQTNELDTLGPDQPETACRP
jgi:ABC transporter substrate binding protein (PQQ-dependent alcohol dehydrogenase system)